MSVLATDNFNRADSADLGASWDVMTSESSWVISGNDVNPSSLPPDCSETYNAVTWPNDQYSQARITAIGGGLLGIGPGVCLRAASASRSYYRIIVNPGTGNNTELGKFVSGSYTQIAVGAKGSAWAVSDVIYAEVRGTTVKVRNGVGGADIISATDSAHASGRVGISYSSESTAAGLDDWEGGDFSAGAFPPLSSNRMRIGSALRAM